MRFAGKSVIVTGAGSGIGRATAMAFARAGAAVFCADLSEALDATVDAIRAEGGQARGEQCDAGNEAQVAALVEAACQAHGGLDVLHANAGVSGGLAGLFDQSAA
ncbi:SDR family NAD(P)-dependent oxidoreductase, partial [Sphingomonas sp.]|uniref:SDR family NAD(P)-dependent oxidoreductase n=1 Tax=Sphingomonas sp. TaxID=28214 RepID=UPI002B7BED0D